MGGKIPTRGNITIRGAEEEEEGNKVFSKRRTQSVFRSKSEFSISGFLIRASNRPNESERRIDLAA